MMTLRKVWAMANGLIFNGLLFGGLYHLFRLFSPVWVSILVTSLIMIIGLTVTIVVAKNQQLFEEDETVSTELKEETERVFNEITEKYPHLKNYKIIYSAAQDLEDIYGIVMPAMCLVPSHSIIIHSHFLNKNNSFDGKLHFKCELDGALAHEMGHAHSNMFPYFLLFGTYTLILGLVNISMIGLKGLFKLRDKLYNKSSILLALGVDVGLLVCSLIIAIINLPLFIFRTPLIRQDEYYADHFACLCGYGEGAKMFFNRASNDTMAIEALLDNFNHPTLKARIKRICDYHHYSRDYIHEVFSEDLSTLVMYCDKKTTLASLPDSIYKIDGQEHLNCFSKIKEIKLNHIEEIGAYSFKNSSNLEKVNIDADHLIIRKEAFANCVNLKEFNFIGKKLEIEEEAFKNCSQLKTFYFESEDVIVQGQAFKGSGLVLISLSSSTQKIVFQANAFSHLNLSCIMGLDQFNITHNCDNTLDHLEIHQAFIHETAFDDCSNLIDKYIITHVNLNEDTQSIVVPEGAKIVVPSALKGFTSVLLYIPDSVMYCECSHIAKVFSTNERFKDKENVISEPELLANYLSHRLLQSAPDFDEVLPQKKEVLYAHPKSLDSDYFEALLSQYLKLLVEYKKAKILQLVENKPQ